MRKNRHSRGLRFLAFVVIGVVLLVGTATFFLLKKDRPWSLRKFTDGQAIGPWKTVVREAGPAQGEPLRQFVYELVGPSGQKIDLTHLPQDDLEYGILERAGKSFLMTRFLGEGTSGAYYYSVYQLIPDRVAILAASQYLSAAAGDEQCVTDLKPVAMETPSNIFGDCGEPYIDKGETLVFSMPGFHCTLLPSPGCPSRTLVSLK